jgi:hypothetical protein
MVTTLSKLVEMIERGSVPAWLRGEILAKKEDITKVLREGGSFTLVGPAGEKVNIRADKSAVAA